MVALVTVAEEHFHPDGRMMSGVHEGVAALVVPEADNFEVGVVDVEIEEVVTEGLVEGVVVEEDPEVLGVVVTEDVAVVETTSRDSQRNN